MLLVLSCAMSCADHSTKPIDAEDDIHAPLPDREAEILALLMSGEIVAPLDLYETVLQDLESIRSAWCDTLPRICSIGPRTDWQIGILKLSVDFATYEAIRTGSYDAWDDLNERYDLDHVQFSDFCRPPCPFVTLYFTPLLNPDFLISEYEQLPGVQSAFKSYFVGDGPNLIGTLIGSQRHYSFQYRWGDCIAGCIHSREWSFVADQGGITYEGESGTTPETIFRLRRSPGLGFCPQPDRIFFADLNQEYPDQYALSGSILRAFHQPRDGCLDVISGNQFCLVEIPFGPVTLSLSQVNTLHSLFYAIPRESIPPHGGCDPCLVSVYWQHGRRIEADHCAFDHSDEFWNAINELEDFLNQFVPD